MKIVLRIKKSIAFWLLLLCGFFSEAQTITGTIIEYNSKKVIKSANILVKDLDNPEIILDFKVVYNGSFSFKLKELNKPILIEIKSYGYKPYEFIIKNTTLLKNYKLNIILKKNTAITLDEVVVVSKKKFEIKKDTIIYNVEAYKDGTERKIIDLLKNLPGIQLDNETGKIKYNGKSIETVLLDGDNLFGHNYTLGTKNINVDMVNSVQAIENYSKNYLLKDIKDNDNKVALNLTLKKGKMNFSGGADLGYGVFNNGKSAVNSNSNILGVKRSYKSFATLAYNNVGENYSPNNYYSLRVNIDELFNKDYFAPKVIPETYFSNVLDGKRGNLNNQFFGNYNVVFKINKHLKVRTSFYYINDKITSEKYIENQYLIDEDSFTTTDNYSTSKKPTQYSGEVEIEYNTSKTSLLEYSLKVKQDNVKTNVAVLSNGETNYNSKLSSESFYLKNKLLYTKKTSNKSAVQVLLLQLASKVPQLFKINPAVTSEDNSFSNIQKIDVKRNYFELQSVLLGKTVKNNKYSFSIGAILDDNYIQSQLFEQNLTDDLNVEDTKNDLKYAKVRLFQNTDYSLRLGEWKFSPAFSFSYLKQQLKENIEITNVVQEDFIVKPSLNISYSISSNSFLLGNVNYGKTSNLENYLFRNEILINNRQVIKNTPSLELQNKLNYGLSYNKNDLFNQLQINGGVSYQKSSGNFFSNSTINENLSLINYFYLPQNSGAVNYNFLIAKYIPFLESTLRLNSNYGVSTYKNVVNNSEIRSNKNQFFNMELYIKTAFDGVINFRNVLKFSNFISKSEGGSEFTNSGLNNSFKILVRPSKKIFLECVADYFLPNSSNTVENYLFLDVLLKYKFKHNRLEFNLTGKNLLNESNFEQVQTTDISTNVYRTNILPRHLMFTVMFNF